MKKLPLILYFLRAKIITESKKEACKGFYLAGSMI